MAEISFENLLSTGAHFGHVTRKWHPEYAPYILMEKNGIHIINLDETLGKLDKALTFVNDVAKKNGEVLFVGTKNKLKILFNRKQIDVECFMSLSAGLVELSQIIQRLKKVLNDCSNWKKKVQIFMRI